MKCLIGNCVKKTEVSVRCEWDWNKTGFPFTLLRQLLTLTVFTGLWWRFQFQQNGKKHLTLYSCILCLSLCFWNCKIIKIIESNNQLIKFLHVRSQ